MAKEKWIHLGYADLIQSLAQDEIDKLEQLSLSANVQDICLQQLDSCSDAFRYSWMSKGYNIDVRDHYVPNGYKVYILNYARPFIASRFPQSTELFIDEVRKDLWKEAKDLLKEAYVGVPLPDYSGTELSGLDSTPDDMSITLPFQRMLPSMWNYGFVSPYIRDYQTSSFYCI